jgi:sec-independent protein translocase protein TatA
MFDGAFSPMHLLIVAFVILLLFGGSRLPKLGKGLGSGIREFKTGLKELHSSDDDEAQGQPVQAAITTQASPAPSSSAEAETPQA